MFMVRDAVAGDAAFLWHALSLISGEPVAALQQVPSSAKYVAGWGRDGDFGVIAERDGVPVAAAWARQFTADDQPMVWIDAHTPELALAVDAAQRGQGVGGRLLDALLERARTRCAGLCLNVREHSPARRLYARKGFGELPGCRQPNRFGSTSQGMLLRFDGAHDGDLSAFLRPSAVIDADHPEVRRLAAHLADGRTDAQAVAAACFDWVRDQVSHTCDAGGGPVTCSASQVLAARTSLCFGKSHLLAALLRANGVPAALCYQRLRFDDPAGPSCLHGLIAVHLPGHGWYRCDPRGNKPGVDAHFIPPVERLAFHPQYDGEGDVPGRFAEPLPQVVDALRRHSDFAALLADLPDLA